MAKVRKFKYKEVKISHDALRDELANMGNDVSLVFCAAFNDGGTFSQDQIEEAEAEIVEAKRRIHRVQEAAQFEAYLSAIA